MYQKSCSEECDFAGWRRCVRSLALRKVTSLDGDGLDGLDGDGLDGDGLDVDGQTSAHGRGREVGSRCRGGKTPRSRCSTRRFVYTAV